MLHLHRVDEIRRRVDRSAWLYQERSTTYAKIALELYVLADVWQNSSHHRLAGGSPSFLQDLSTRAKTKAMLERNNMSNYTGARIVYYV